MYSLLIPCVISTVGYTNPGSVPPAGKIPPAQPYAGHADQPPTNTGYSSAYNDPEAHMTEEAPFTGRSFSDKAIRRAFIRKVGNIHLHGVIYMMRVFAHFRSLVLLTAESSRTVTCDLLMYIVVPLFYKLFIRPP